MKKQTLRRFSKISCILLTGLLLCSCSTPVEIAEPTDYVISVESETESVDALPKNREYEAIRKEEHDEPFSTPETEIIPIANASSGIEVVAVITKPTSKPTKVPADVAPLTTATAEPTGSPTTTPLSEANESQGAPTPKLTSQPTATPTVQPTAHSTVKPLPTATPIPTAAPTATPKPTATPTPAPTKVPKTEKVWIVDVPGHYETVEEVAEIWVDEQGHWEGDGYWASDWVYQCNQCGEQYQTVEAVNQHLDDSFDWDTMTGHSSYTQVSGPTYWVETDPAWVVDIPSHFETVTETKTVWVEEQGHWENVVI